MGGAPRRVPARRRPAVGTLAPHGQRGDHARPVEDGPSGRGRRGLRTRRLLALQPVLRDADLRRPAGVGPRDLEPHGLPSPRRVRLRRHAVQLHVHRRQPADRAGDDGRHRRLEAGLDEHAERLLRPAPARGGRPAAGRGQPRLRPGRRGRRPGAGSSAPRRRPLHRIDGRLSRDLAHRGRRHRALCRLPAHRGRDRRQGLHRRPPHGRRRRARHRRRAWRLRIPGAEVLGGVAPVRAALAVAPGARASRRRRREHPHGRHRRLHELHGRGHRRGELRDAATGDRRRRGRPTHRGPGRRPVRRQRRLLRAPDGARDVRPVVPHHARGAVRAGADDLRVRRRCLGRDVAPRRLVDALRSHGGRVRARPGGDRPRRRGPAPRRGQLLRQ